MSTRCTINFGYSEPGAHSKPVAKIYRHSDGYPEGVLPDLATFFGEVERQTSDTRFGDPSYLAAKFVVWQAGEFAQYAYRAKVDPAPLAFLSLGVLDEDPGDIEYTYWLACEGDGRPRVFWHEADKTAWQRDSVAEETPASA